MEITKNKIKIAGIILVLLFLLTKITGAIEYAPLEPNAFGADVTKAASTDLTSFLATIFSFGIAIAVALALIMIIWVVL